MTIIKGKILTCKTPFIISQPLSIINLLIRVITKQPRDHALLIFNIPQFNNKDFVFQATGKGISLIRIDEYLKHANHRHRKHFICQREFQIEGEFVGKILDAKYKMSSYWQLVLFLISRRLFGKKSNITSLFTTELNEYKYICSELVSEAIYNEKTIEDFRKAFNLKQSEEPKFHLISPGDLETIFNFKQIDLNLWQK